MANEEESLTREGAPRSCGSCSLCCVVLRVDELGKLAGEPCPKLDPAGGCSIHETRPAVCRGYQCHWSKGGFETPDRPDRLGAVVDFAPGGLTLHLAIVEATPGAFAASPRLRGIADRYREQMDVRVSDTRDVLDAERPIRVLQARGRELLIEGSRVRTYDEGVLVADERLPAIERMARFVQQRVASWKWRWVSRARGRALDRRS